MSDFICSTTVTDSMEDWFTTTSLNKEHIREQTKKLLNRPAMVDDSTDERLYSEDQMLEMFRFGFETISETSVGKKIIAQLKRIASTPYRIIRNMDVGEKRVFPYESWNAVRSAAGAIKRVYGTTFRVVKLAKSGEIGDIEIIRTL